MRFYEFDRGRILIDGHDIKDYSQEVLRKSIGLVLQEPFLYHGTIASNIRMYHEELTEAESNKPPNLWMWRNLSRVYLVAIIIR